MRVLNYGHRHNAIRISGTGREAGQENRVRRTNRPQTVFLGKDLVVELAIRAIHHPGNGRNIGLPHNRGRSFSGCQNIRAMRELRVYVTRSMWTVSGIVSWLVIGRERALVVSLACLLSLTVQRRRPGHKHDDCSKQREAPLPHSSSMNQQSLILQRVSSEWNKINEDADLAVVTSSLPFGALFSSKSLCSYALSGQSEVVYTKYKQSNEVDCSILHYKKQAASAHQTSPGDRLSDRLSDLLSDLLRRMCPERVSDSIAQER